MADKQESALTQQSDCKWVRALDANGNSIRISKEDLAAVVGGLLPTVTTKSNGLMNSETYLLSTKVFVNKTFKIWTLEQFQHALFEMFAKGLDNTIYHYLIFCRDTTIRIQKMDFHSNNDHAIKILKDSKNNIYIQSPNAYSLVAISIVGALPVSTLSWDNYNDDTSSFEEILPSN